MQVTTLKGPWPAADIIADLNQQPGRFHKLPSPVRKCALPVAAFELRWRLPSDLRQHDSCFQNQGGNKRRPQPVNLHREGSLTIMLCSQALAICLQNVSLRCCAVAHPEAISASRSPLCRAKTVALPDVLRHEMWT